MTPTHKACWTLLAALTVASVLSCGKPAGPGAAFKPATAAPSLPRGGGPASALPSLAVSGEIAAFRASSTEAGPQKRRDMPGGLPSHVTAGRTAVYTPGRAPETATSTPAARMATTERSP